MVTSEPTARTRAGLSWRTFIITVAAFVVGLGVGLLAKPTPPDPRRLPDAPDEISVHTPDGRGGHDSVRIVVSAPPVTETDVQGALPATEYKVQLYYFPPGDSGGKVRYVAYRGPVPAKAR